jgi:hypothetical protein
LLAAPDSATMAVVTADQVRDSLHAAFDRFLVQWARRGGHRYHGRPSADDPRSYSGPMVWSENDCVYRLALELEKEFPGQVHFEFKMSASSVWDFDVGKGDTQDAVDLVVSDLDDFVEDESSHRRFGTKQHELFIEAKWFQKRFWTNSVRAGMEGVKADALKQEKRLERGRCLVAALLVVDDENAFEDRRHEVAVPDGIELLVASPRELRQRGLVEPGQEGAEQAPEAVVGPSPRPGVTAADRPRQAASAPGGPATGGHSQADALFSSIVDRIEAAYDRLGHHLGWRFLYTPARTLAPDTRLATVGVNPGGDAWEAPSPSVEAGNAYRLETWPGGSNGGTNPLQTQIRLFYDALAPQLGDRSPTRLMDDTLAANFCPFRSPSWDALANRAESIAFSRELWRSILEVVSPSVVICLGELPARELGTTLLSTGARSVGVPEVRPVGWGSVTYGLAQYESSSGRSLLVRLPHPSRYAIFGRAGSEAAVERLTSVIAAAMAGNAGPLPSQEAREPPLPELSPEPSQATRGRPLPSPIGLGARATALLGKASYNINEYRADRFLEMLEQIPGLRSELEARDLGELRRMVSPGGRVDTGLNRRFAGLVAHYARGINYEQVNWLRGAIAVYVAERAQPNLRAR